MSKIICKPDTMIYPVPAVMVSCGSHEKEYNIITIAWTGTICTSPPMCYISVRPNRHSYNIIKKNKEFVINLTNEELAYATDWCGIKSGRNVNKFNEMNLTPVKASKIDAPIIEEATVNIECKVKDIISLGSHDMFIAEVVAINISDKYVNKNTGEINLKKGKLICYAHRDYLKLGDVIGQFGFSIRK